MFVIFGTKEKHKEVGHGEFFCPACKTTRHYIQHESAPYFSLYFIPIVKLGSSKTYIQCQVCHNLFSSDLLTQDTRRLAVLALINDMDKEVKSGTPSHIIYRKLLGRGLPEATAKAISMTLLGNQPKVCKACGALYHERIDSCSNCGGVLVEQQDQDFWKEKQAAEQVYAQITGKR
jgi:hypothetical protein